MFHPANRLIERAGRKHGRRHHRRRRHRRADARACAARGRHPLPHLRVGAEIRPLGVGINLLPHATKELAALGLEAALAQVAIDDHGGDLLQPLRPADLSGAARPRAPATTHPQFSIHRGDLQQVLLDAVRARAGRDRLLTGPALRRRRTGRGRRHACIFRRAGRRRPLHRARPRRDRLRRHPLRDPQAVLPGRRRAALFRRQHVARRDALAADPVGREHGARRLAGARQDGDLSDPRRRRRRRAAARQLGRRDRDARTIASATGTGPAQLDDFIARLRRLAFRLARRARAASAPPTACSNFRWSTRTRCRAGASAA